MTWNSALVVLLHIEELVNSKIAGTTPERQTSEWLAKLDDSLHKRLAATGLIVGRARARLGEYLAAYIAERTDVKQSTKRKWKQTHKSLLVSLGEKTPVRQITPGDAEQWRRSLGTVTPAELKARKKPKRSMCENTRRNYTSIAKVFFNAAVKKRLIESNPFQGLAATVMVNPTKQREITRDQAARILEACPDTQWRLLFALARFGGLRCPSETLALTWENVDWERSRMRVGSSKTEHHVGKDSRVVPIFPELRPHL